MPSLVNLCEIFEDVFDVNREEITLEEIGNTKFKSEEIVSMVSVKDMLSRLDQCGQMGLAH